MPKNSANSFFVIPSLLVNHIQQYHSGPGPGKVFKFPWGDGYPRWQFAVAIWFFATGTGFAPFASLLREPQTYEDYDEVIITHTCRTAGELTYGRELIEGLKDDELLNEVIGEGFWKKIKYYPTTTREESPKMGRITDLMRDGTVFKDLDVEPIHRETDRAMVCGNLAFNLEIKELLESYGLEEGANSDPKHYVVEKAFLD